MDAVELWLRRGCAGVLAAVAVATPAAASAATVARPGAATAVREYGGTIVFSQFDWPTRRWYLSVRRAGAKSPERLGVASSPVSFQADIGTDSAGRPELIYQRCGRAVSTTPPAYELTGCDLFVYSLVDGTGERPVRNANDPAHNDVNPTLWRGRIAWTREYGSGEHANPVVYTKTLTAPRSRPSTRLPGVPSTRCGDVDKVCAPTVYRSVEALELRGDLLVAIVRYVCNACGGISQTEVRLDAVADRSSRQVAYLLTGLLGQRFAGPSVFDGRLAWYKGCALPESGCRNAGPWRYQLSKRRYERGTPGAARVDGLADTGSRLYEVLDCPDDTGEENASCRIDELEPPAYAAAPAPVR